METGHVVYFPSQKYPFLVEIAPCLDLACSCSMVTLTLSEVLPPGSARRDQLTFTLRMSLKTWIEHDPPPRSLEVELLAREFVARFPDERIEELGEEFEQARADKRRLESLSLSGPRDKLVTYSDVIDERGGVREGVTEHSIFFVFEGREFFVEDHYCANPECDCQLVHLEFWERVQSFLPKHRIDICQKLMATFTLKGELKETRFNEESDSTAKYLLAAWVRRCGEHFQDYRRRYELIKTIGARSFPTTPKPSADLAVNKEGQPKKRILRVDSKPKARRNAPCPCGSGLKFKRCCARRAPVED